MTMVILFVGLQRISRKYFSVSTLLHFYKKLLSIKSYHRKLLRDLKELLKKS